MYVVGATKAEMLSSIRKIVPDHFLLVPGVGAQGGSLSEVARYGMNDRCGLLVNSSRAIIYADSSERFADAAGQAAKDMRDQMTGLLESGVCISVYNLFYISVFRVLKVCFLAGNYALHGI